MCFCLNKKKFYHLGLRSLGRSGPRSSIRPWISLAGRNFWKLSTPNLWEPRHDQLKLLAARAPGHRGLTSRLINTFCTKPFIDWSQGLAHISFSYLKERLPSLSHKSRPSAKRLEKQSARQETWVALCLRTDASQLVQPCPNTPVTGISHCLWHKTGFFGFFFTPESAQVLHQFGKWGPLNILDWGVYCSILTLHPNWNTTTSTKSPPFPSCTAPYLLHPVLPVRPAAPPSVHFRGNWKQKKIKK